MSFPTKMYTIKARACNPCDFYEANSTARIENLGTGTVWKCDVCGAEYNLTVLKDGTLQWERKV